MIDFSVVSAALTMFLNVVLLLSIATSVIVQVIKGLFPETIPSNLICFVTAFVVTFAAGFIYATAVGLQIKMWMLIGCIGLAFATAFAAMYGFDKLKELVAQWKEKRED